MLTMMYLQIPRILIKPSLEEIQTAFSQVMNYIASILVNINYNNKINFDVCLLCALGGPKLYHGYP